jgi:nitrous oxidase accessory protein NosD
MEYHTTHSKNQEPYTTIHKLNRFIQKKLNDHTVHNNKKQTRPKKWTVFTYYHPSIRHITNMFKNNNTGIALRNTNTIHDLLRFTKNDTTYPYTKSGICKLSCNTSEHSYVGQTGRT